MGVVISSSKDHSGHDHSGHSHEPLEVSKSDQIPTVTLTVLKDPMSGWNAKVVVEHFRFAPENASQDHVAGEGHGHLYVDGVKINRLYGDWYHLGKLSAGSHTVMVSLSSNDHRDLTQNTDRSSRIVSPFKSTETDYFHFGEVSDLATL